jgi:BirA family biotin operon repressor/biotin-[acetyl-CoA-carboxylase] ligase
LDVDEALLASIIVRPNAPVRYATRLPLAVCARLVGALDLVAPSTNVRSKWPNDLLVPARAGAADAPRFGPFRKVGGVLIEATDFANEGASLACCVVGIGINVRGAVPAEVADSASTLADAGYPGGVGELVTWVHAAVLDACTALDDASFTAIRALLESRSATIGRHVRVDEGGDVVEGTALAIDADGALVVQRADGTRVTVRAGDADVA